MFMGGFDKKPLVVVDYAHTPDALSQVLKALHLHKHSIAQVWVILGCGGDRDKAKRPIMARIAEAHSDRLILTQDNPRTEDPKGIMQDMIQGLVNPSTVLIEYDRGAAIKMAIRKAQSHDLILVAGKGHETCQIIGSTSLPFSDIEVVQQCLEALA